jgi:hypothetical protein
MQKRTTIILQLLVLVIFAVWLFPYFTQAPLERSGMNTDRCKDGTYEGYVEGYADGSAETSWQLVYITSVVSHNGEERLVVDPIEPCTEADNPPDLAPQCYFKNRVLEANELPVAPAVSVFAQTWSHTSEGGFCADEEISFADFKDFGFTDVGEKIDDARTRLPQCFSGREFDWESYDCVERQDGRSLLVNYTDIPFVIEVRDGKVEKIVERYIP